MSETDVISVPEALVRVHAVSARRRGAASAAGLCLAALLSAFWFLVFLVAATPIAFLPLVALASSIIGIGSSISRSVGAHRALGVLEDGPGVLGAEYAADASLLVLRLGDGQTLALPIDAASMARAQRRIDRRGVLPEARLLRSPR